MSNDKMRFELHYLDGTGCVYPPSVTPDGKYEDFDMQAHWETWQAALTQQPESHLLGHIDRDEFGLIRWREGLMMSELKEGMAIYGGLPPSAQRPESEPVYQRFNRAGGGWDDIPKEDYQKVERWPGLHQLRILYTSPPP